VLFATKHWFDLKDREDEVTEGAELGTRRSLQHDVKTLKMCITATRSIDNAVPPGKIIFQQPYSFDLTNPAPWRAQHVDSYDAWDLRIKFFVNLATDSKKFYPPEILNYLRLEAAAWAEVINPEEENHFGVPPPAQPATFQMWFDTGCSYAAEVIQLGPLARDELFVSFAVKFEND
jgi:hypothetical protein